MTTTGVTASIPASLALVEAMAGSAKAKATAGMLGVDNWTSDHMSASFRLTAGQVALVVRNYLSFWKHETLPIPVADGFDEIALALSADAWSRTYRSQAIAVSISDRVRSRHGLIVVPDQKIKAGGIESRPFTRSLSSVSSIDRALETIAERYGSETAALVSLQLEYMPNDWFQERHKR
ncbi:hypothetical protein [Shinella oryzae]|uniref:Uncharacterized protein n=1 Tax=Shinella oryzae TaxID=2871820 RepID=A0ABY9K8Q2_9HYPH|nr:hypothetical protein [Shinella oryzae]WLS04958.1 hypothetical protein Q9315_22525 [Shinella oryzae]